MTHSAEVLVLCLVGTGLAACADSATEQHWSFRPPRQAPLPFVQDESWSRNPIDRFVRSKLEAQGLAPSPEAKKRVLIRRLFLDLIGLLPSPTEVASFVSDERPDAYERLVDHLLASPHYGERWGRHWLDLARYADSNGFALDSPRSIWKYRDWVIEALNHDLSYDRFIIEQLAGDLLPAPTVDQLVATGFNRNAPLNIEDGVDFEDARNLAVVDRTDTTATVFLGLTLECARCHDHKFDPLSQKEYFQFLAFFNSSVDPVIHDVFGKRLQSATSLTVEPILEFADGPNGALRAQRRAEADARRAQLLEVDPRDPRRLDAEKVVLELYAKLPPVTTTMVMKELERPRPTHVQLGGDFRSLGEAVEPNTPSVLPALLAQGPRPNRLDLARWIASPGNPLTARVAVNRVWAHYFGVGLVETGNDFGLRGARPAHPELLDWLAVEFVSAGWSLKKLHRLIVTSATYRQASQWRADAVAIDPGNRLLARQERLRLDAEILRDISLCASGKIQLEIGGPSVQPPQPAGAFTGVCNVKEWPTSQNEQRYRRGLYTYCWRSIPAPTLNVFDAPDPAVPCGGRARSNTPLQALLRLNSEEQHECALGLGQRLLLFECSDEQRLKMAFCICLGCQPAAAEATLMLETLSEARRLARGSSHPVSILPAEYRQLPDVEIRELLAWATIARILLNLDEFITRE